MKFKRSEVFVISTFAAFGVLWTGIEILDFFGGENVSKIIKPYWWVFGLLGLGYGFYKTKKKKSISYKVNNRDASINVVMKDIFEIPGSLIVPVNNQFKINQDGELLQSKSILAQVVRKYYSSKPSLLQGEIDKKLNEDFYKNYRINNEYKIGTVVPLSIAGKKFYFLSNTKLNQQNKSYCDDEMFEKSLNELWVYLQDCASKEDYVIPLIGTGNGRLNTDRQIVFQEILLSFLSSLSSKNYAESLSICINPTAIKKKIIDFDKCQDFAISKVTYHDYKTRGIAGSNVSGV